MDFDSHRHLWILGFLLAGLLTLIGLPPYVATSSAKCPLAIDISRNVSNCLNDYRAFEERHRLTGSHLFTAVDVEIVRTLCSDLKTSMRCLKSLKDLCPAAFHGRLDGIIRPYVPVVELCDYQRLYEEYAMNQNCLHGQREYSDNCYRTYLAQTKLSLAGSHQQTCLYLTELASCVRTNFAQMCSDSSVQLVDLLVKAAVNDSYRCNNHSPNRAPTITTASQKSSRHGQHHQSNRAYPTIHCSISSSLSVITSTVLLFSRFR